MVEVLVVLEFTNDSWITHVKYDTEKETMLISMKGDFQDYECGGVKLSDYKKFENADSCGIHFNKHIKGKFVSKDFKF